MSWINKSCVFVFAAAVLLLSACTDKSQKLSPEQVLDAYIRTAIGARNVSARSRLLEFTAGAAYEKLAALSDEDFKAVFVDTKLKLIRLKTRDLRKETDGSVSLIYEIVYRKEGESADNSDTTNRKIAFLIADADGVWKIRSTRTVKTYIEAKEALVVDLSK